jgi:hypothetical protein
MKLYSFLLLVADDSSLKIIRGKDGKKLGIYEAS